MLHDRKQWIQFLWHAVQLRNVDGNWERKHTSYVIEQFTIDIWISIDNIPLRERIVNNNDLLLAIDDGLFN